MSYQRVFVDANVLVSRTTRDWLMQLRMHTDGMFQIHTTEDVLAEAVSSLRNLKPNMPGGAMTHFVTSVRGVLDEIVGDFDTSVPYTGKDPDDLHVHAAAVGCGADVLLSDDKGFAQDDTTPYELFTCDEFFILVDDSSKWLVRETVKKVNAYWQKQPIEGRKSLGEALRAAGCPEFAGRVESHLKDLSGVKRARKH